MNWKRFAYLFIIVNKYETLRSLVCNIMILIKYFVFYGLVFPVWMCSSEYVCILLWFKTLARYYHFTL